MAAPKLYNDRMAWFKHDAGRFMADVAGLSLSRAGAYAQLMSLYWMLDNSLPSDPAILMRKMFAFTPEDVADVEAILQEFFPLDADGKYCHALLDQQLSDVRAKSAQASAAGSARGGSKPKPVPAPAPTPEQDDF